jgi:hypothetical protein
MDKILALARKLKALAEQGVGGEKVNAQKMLLDLCKKHNINPDTLDQEKRKRHTFIGTRLTEAILVSVVAKVCGRKREQYQPHKKKYGVQVDVSEAERLEILALYGIYARAYERTLSDMETAFIFKNDIFPPDDDDDEEEPQTEEDKEQSYRIIQLMGGLERTQVQRELGPATRK